MVKAGKVKKTILDPSIMEVWGKVKNKRAIIGYQYLTPSTNAFVFYFHNDFPKKLRNSKIKELLNLANKIGISITIKDNKKIYSNKK